MISLHSRRRSPDGNLVFNTGKCRGQPTVYTRLKPVGERRSGSVYTGGNSFNDKKCDAPPQVSDDGRRFGLGRYSPRECNN